MSDNTNEDQGKRLRIRLDKSRTDRSFDEEESLWKSEMKRMFKMVKAQFDVITTDAELDKLPLLSIGIFGSPGSGKSSLLKTFVKRVNGKSDEVPGEIRGNIYSMPVISPNRLAEDDHFMYNFLAHALKAERDEDKNKKKGDQYKDSSILSEIQQKFEELSDYLKVVNEKEQSGDDDPLGVTLERMERHESGLILKEKMGEFITVFANKMAGLGKSLVLMPVDDADLSVPILSSVLDTCWRYLRHPRLVPVFTFTGRLAEEMLRVYFESKVALKDIKSSPEKLMQSSISLMMTETLALQYLGKLFPVRNRIRLGPAAARVLAADYTRRMVTDTDDNNGETVEKFICKEDSKEYELICKKKKSDSQECERKKVLELLQNASFLLFGCPDAYNPRDVKVKAPFRVVTLRRQLQIVDAMEAAGIMDFINEFWKNNNNKEVGLTWGMVFDRAVWSLMNNHRDILREIKMYLDDLYTWTPHGLRQVILGSILSLDLKKRRQFLMHWRYNTDDRRSQMLSLLAANVFRPCMEGEDFTGDNLNKIEEYAYNSEKKQITKDKAYSFPVWQGTAWFIELFIGFYLPQILSCNTEENPDRSKNIGDSTKPKKTGVNNDSSKENTAKDEYSCPITAVGWDLFGGPLRAVREALYNRELFFSGMLIYDSNSLEEIFKVKDETKSIIFNLWCYYGYDGGKPFVALSLWRGLGLIGQLLKLNFYETENEKNEKEETEKKRIEKEKTEKIKEILENHLKDARVIVNPPKRDIHENADRLNEKNGKFNFDVWKWNKNNNTDKKIRDEMETDIKEKWLGEFKSNKRIKPMAPHIPSLKKINDSKNTKEDIEKLKDDWKNCFIRRLHGNNLLSIFWKDLEDVFFKILEPSIGNVKKINDPKIVLEEWVSVLLEYWCYIPPPKNKNKDKQNKKTSKKGTGQDKDDYTESFVKDALIECPILKPFIKENKTTNETNTGTKG